MLVEQKYVKLITQHNFNYVEFQKHNVRHN